MSDDTIKLILSIHFTHYDDLIITTKQRRPEAEMTITYVDGGYKINMRDNLYKWNYTVSTLDDLTQCVIKNHVSHRLSFRTMRMQSVPHEITFWTAPGDIFHFRKDCLLLKKTHTKIEVLFHKVIKFMDQDNDNVLCRDCAPDLLFGDLCYLYSLWKRLKE